jgi:hypothetical protein
LLVYAPVAQYFCRVIIKNLLSFSLNTANLREAHLYHYYYPYNTVAGWYYLLPGILVEEHDPFARGADKRKDR